jgi:YebC/PmpR family DNA-binding regulatory protein
LKPRAAGSWGPVPVGLGFVRSQVPKGEGPGAPGMDALALVPGPGGVERAIAAVVYSLGWARVCAGISIPAEVLMSGHSKWATIKHKKGALDAKRGKIFTRLIREITISAKGGGDPDGNPRLRTAILAAKAENMPQENIKRAIQRGTGELEGVNYEEIKFEGYGPGGVAIIVDVTTDNRNRAVSEIRHAFSKNGGNLGETGSVRFLFSKKGLIAVEKIAATEDQLMDIVLEHGGEDLNDEGDTWEILTDPSAYEAVAGAIKAAGIATVMSEVTMVASTYTKLEGNAANQMIRLLEALEDCDDTQNVYSNFDMDAEQMEHAAG